MGRDVELQITLIVLFKSTKDVLQINTISQHLGLGSQLKEWYQGATSVPYGHLLIDLTPKQLIHLGIALIVAHFQQRLIYQIELRQNFRTSSTQYVSILPIFQKISLRLQKQFILNCPNNFFQFLIECSVKLLRGELRDPRKEDVVKYRKKNSQLTQKNTPLHKWRNSFSSAKDL